MTRLATLIIEQKRFFFPMPEEIMTDPEDDKKPGAFLELFPHPLSKLFLVLLWRIHSQQDGDAAVLSNKWLKVFAQLENRSLLRYRRFLNDHKIITAVSLGSGREFLYRLINTDTGLPLTDETDIEAVKRLKDPGRIREAVRARIMRRYRKRPTGTTAQEQQEPLSSWSEWQ